MHDPALEPVLALHRAGRLAEAEAGYRDCLATGNEAAAFPLGVVLLQQGRHAQAAAVLEPLAATRPEDAAVQTNLSIALRLGGRLEDALAAARHAVAAAPTDVGALNALGLAALATGQAEAGLQAFEAALRHAPGTAALLLHRGKCLLQLGRVEAAIETCVQAANAAPGLAEAWRTLASAQAVGGQREAALESSRRALALAPDDATVQLEFAAALLRAGHAAAAVKRLEALHESAGDNARTLAWLGRAHLRAGDRTAARAAFDRAHALDPHDPMVAHFRAALVGELPQGVERAYVRELFDDFAGRFETTLVGELGYTAPSLLASLLDEDGLPLDATVLDLGCGTGLMGAALAGAQRRIDGVDLSPRMLERARAKGVYRSLHEAELIEFLGASGDTWDAIVAADVLNYMADLEPALAAAARRLAAGGRLAFSVECSATQATELVPETGRYRHVVEQLESVLDALGFMIIRREPSVLRLESGAPVHGALLLARLPPA